MSGFALAIASGGTLLLQVACDRAFRITEWRAMAYIKIIPSTAMHTTINR
jgi:hypothetical protein